MAFRPFIRIMVFVIITRSVRSGKSVCNQQFKLVVVKNIDYWYIRSDVFQYSLNSLTVKWREENFSTNLVNEVNDFITINSVLNNFYTFISRITLFD